MCAMTLYKEHFNNIDSSLQQKQTKKQTNIVFPEDGHYDILIPSVIFILQDWTVFPTERSGELQGSIAA